MVRVIDAINTISNSLNNNDYKEIVKAIQLFISPRQNYQDNNNILNKIIDDPIIKNCSIPVIKNYIQKCNNSNNSNNKCKGNFIQKNENLFVITQTPKSTSTCSSHDVIKTYNKLNLVTNNVTNIPDTNTDLAAIIYFIFKFDEAEKAASAQVIAATETERAHAALVAAENERAALVAAENERAALVAAENERAHAALETKQSVQTPPPRKPSCIPNPKGGRTKRRTRRQTRRSRRHPHRRRLSQTHRVAKKLKRLK